MFSDFFSNSYPLPDIARQYWMVLPIAFIVSLIATPICRIIALKTGIIDRPDNKVKTHKQPTAYLGGLGILAGLLAAIAVGFYILMNTPSNYAAQLLQADNLRIMIGVTIGAIIATIVGLIDDIYDIKPTQKFLGQTLAAITLIAVGVHPDLHTPCRLIFNYYMPHNIEVLVSIPIVLFFILGATNSLNLLDGLDGLCGGVTAIITIAFLLLALSLSTWCNSPAVDPVRLILCLGLAGGTLGFLPMNRHPAKIFMGDAGSMLLGFIAGTLMILFTERVGRWSTGTIIIFGLPILDTATALIRRYLNKKPLFVSDRGHIYDQLMDRGLGLKKTVQICYGLAVVYSLIGLSMTQFRFRYSVIALIVVIILSFLAIWAGGFLQIPHKTKPGDKTALNQTGPL